MTTTDIQLNSQDEHKFTSTIDGSLLTYNYLVVLSVQQNKTDDKMSFVWTSLDSTTGETTDETSVHECVCNSLSQALQKFDQYCFTTFLQENNTFCLVVPDAESMLRDLIFKQASNDGIKLADHYMRFYDLKQNHSFSDANTNSDQQSLVTQMVGLIKTKFFGTAPVPPKSQKTLSASSKPWQPPTTKTDSVQERPPRKYHHPLSVVRLRGLPWTATEEDIITFFTEPPIVEGDEQNKQQQGLPSPNTVLILINFHGRSTGEAYVEWVDENNPTSNNEEFISTAQRALNEYQGKHLGPRYIEIFPASINDLHIAQQLMNSNTQPPLLPPQVHSIVSSVVPASFQMELERSCAVRVRGMPFNSSIEDLLTFFDPLTMNDPHDSIILITSPLDGKFIGEAFVLFDNVMDANEALKCSSKPFSSKGVMVEVFKVPEQEGSFVRGVLNGTIAPPPFITDIPNISYQRNQPQPHQHLHFSDHVVRVRGLPFFCDENHIAEFFSGLNISSGGIHLILNESNDKSTGEALVEFTSEQDVESALKRHRQMIGKRYIEVFKSNKKEQDSNSNSEDDVCEDKRRMSYHNKMLNGMPSGIEGFVAPNFIPMIGYHHSYPQQYHVQYPPQRSYKPHTVFFEYGESTVRVRGLPFTSTNQDIFKFFEGFKLSNEDVQMRFDSNGRKNGEAYLNFESAEEAKRAVEERNRCNMGSRYIELFLLGKRTTTVDKV
ncbi:hypothetical protein AKO1_008233 [Acrasis kona]|uniref:RRM domain-containing protein n=1 Tax=Acrasis kona TaxID=1008807 RepID=A0AAW2YPG2_9EUKA